MFNKFANSVEGFTTHLLDPMQSNQNQRFGFGNFILDDILDDAIDLEQKKVMLKVNTPIILDNHVKGDDFVDRDICRKL